MHSSEDSIAINWIHRQTPLPAFGVVGLSNCATQLVRRLLELDSLAAQFGDAGVVPLDNYRCAASGKSGQPDSMIVITGPAESLPWADGAVYFGLEPDTSMFLPTNCGPDVAAVLVERALRMRHPALMGKMLVVPALCMVASMEQLFPVSRDALALWLKGDS